MTYPARLDFVLTGSSVEHPLAWLFASAELEIAKLCAPP
jgi:hypothetical protein